MIYLAHSPKNGRPAQPYTKHIQGVTQHVLMNLDRMKQALSEQRYQDYYHILKRAALAHDLGKLNQSNQEELHKMEGHLEALPIEHRDAAVKLLLGDQKENSEATLVYAHHRPGLPNMLAEKAAKYPFRFQAAMKDSEAHCEQYVAIHEALLEPLPAPTQTTHLSALTYRILLSCLAAADYADSSGNKPVNSPDPRWNLRLQQLSERVSNESVFYQNCCQAEISSPLVYCETPPGMERFYGLLSSALRVAEKQKLRHIIILLPYSSLINSVLNLIQQMLILDKENPDEIVNGIYLPTEFKLASDKDSKNITSISWRVPILVMSEALFFKTLASNHPNELYKLHQLPSSAIIWEKGYFGLHAKQLPLAWRWVNELAQDWNCWLWLTSEIPFHFWEAPVFQNTKWLKPSALFPCEHKDFTAFFPNVKLNLEKGEIPHFQGLTSWINWICSYRGSKIAVFNNELTAAIAADQMRKNGMNVQYYSNALLIKDQKKVIAEIHKRMKSKRADWTLVTCDDFDFGIEGLFQYGFCQLHSLASYLQLSSIIKQEQWVFTIAEDRFVTDAKDRVDIEDFKQRIKSQCLISSEALTEAFVSSSKKAYEDKIVKNLLKAEQLRAFVDVEKQFKQEIPEQILVVVNAKIAEKLKLQQTVKLKELQLASVRVQRRLLKLYHWSDEEVILAEEGQYDSFLGLMKTMVQAETK